MGHGLCRRRAAISEPENDRHDRRAVPSNAQRAAAEELCEQCTLAYSRVGRESLWQCKTVGDLDDYVADLQARERLLAGYTGGEDRQQAGLTGSG
ncbi:unnamed protein product [Effrenium voratum]|uniref:Uncharacterized protein n=1 Tax=Effrenium voratum TaxID=2562239 RepID=A0AA36J2I9_9DINO|nr:unnamed protein product [Effrenium voratum]CAJ1398440.1 unnamed protein product [Effrenium voratum]